MRFVGTALVAGTIAVFSLLTEGGWSRAGTGQSVEPESASPKKGRKDSFRYRHFHDVEGITVQNVDGETIGTINDLIVEPKSGRPRYVIIKSSGSLLARQRLVIVPISAVAITTAKVGIAALDVTRRQWKNAPEFSRKDFTLLAQPERAHQIERFYERAERVARVGQTVSRPNAQISATGPGTNSAALPRENGSYELASDLIDKPVITRQRAQIGEVADLVVDFSGDKPALAVVSAERISDAGDRFAVPFHLLSLTPDRKIVVNAERSEFEHAKSLERHSLANNESHEIFHYER